MADLLRGTAAFGGFMEALEIHLVEVSQRLRWVGEWVHAPAREGGSVWGALGDPW
jgi:hypothetical protein